MKSVDVTLTISDPPPRTAVHLRGFLLFCAAMLCFSTVTLAQLPTRAKESGVPRTPLRQSLETEAASGNLEYVIDADDVLDVYIVDVPQLSRDYRVGPDGNIMIPLLSSPIMAEGLTLNQLSAVIANKLRTAGLVSHPHAIVTVKSSQAHAVAISGAVQNPQIYPIFGPTTLLDVLSQAGGLAPDAGSTAIITRGGTAMQTSWFDKGSASVAPAEQTIKVNLEDLLATGNPKSNILIYPGDTVTVQRAGIVYVVGAVRRAGGFTLAGSWQRMTILKAIALAGNLTANAQQKKAYIIRQDAAALGGHKNISVNLKKILAGRAPDRPLEANDVLFVPNSTGKEALRRGLESALGIGSGLLIYHAPL